MIGNFLSQNKYGFLIAFVSAMITTRRKRIEKKNKSFPKKPKLDLAVLSVEGSSMEQKKTRRTRVKMLKRVRTPPLFLKSPTSLLFPETRRETLTEAEADLR